MPTTLVNLSPEMSAAIVYLHRKPCNTNARYKSTWEILPLLFLCYQHSASLFGFRWKRGRWRNRSLLPVGYPYSLLYPGFQDQLPSILFEKASPTAASSIQGNLTGLEPAITGSTNQCLDHFSFRYHQWNQWELNP